MVKLCDKSTRLLSSLSWKAGEIQKLHMSIGLIDPLPTHVTIDHKRDATREIHIHFSIPITGLPGESNLGNLPQGTVMFQMSFFVATSVHLSEMHLLEYQASCVVQNPSGRANEADSAQFTRILRASTSNSPRGVNSFFHIDQSRKLSDDKSREILSRMSESLTGLLVKLEDDLAEGLWL